MKVPRNLIGRMVEITWRDPCFFHRVGGMGLARPLAQMLGVGVERGRVGKVEDGVVRIDHSIGRSPSVPGQDGGPDDEQVSFTTVQEDLIEHLIVFPEPASTDPAP